MDYDKFISEKARQIKPSGIRKFFDIVASTKDAISLGVGEPDFITPYSIRNSAIKSIQKGQLQYTSNSGLFSLREKISQYLSVRFNLDYDPKDEVIVTVGASEAIDISLRTLINAGDEVLIAEPCYVSYSPCVILAGGVPVAVECTSQTEFKITAENIEKRITPKTKAILLCFPSNPTGAIMTQAELKKIAQVIVKHDLLVISDEIYGELTYKGKHFSIANLEGLRQRTILVSGFSKAFSMTGWRIGYLCCDRELAKVILKIHQYVIMCAPTISQYGALEALTEGLKDNFSIVEEMKDEYNKRRRFVYKSLVELGFESFEPLGAFYIFPSVKKYAENGTVFAEQLLESQKLAVVPGNAFSQASAEHIRISYAYSMKTLNLALLRLENFVKQK